MEPGPVRRTLLSRRALLGLGLALVAAGCNAESPKGKPGGAPGTAPTSAGAGAGGSVAQIGGAHVPSSQQLSASDAQRLATRSNGHWRGGWHDSTGAAGSSDVVISLDTNSRTARVRVAFGGDLLGAPVPAEVYEIDLLSFMLGADSYDVTSPQFGELRIVPGGADSTSTTARSVPGHPAIASIDLSGSRNGQRVDVNYVIRYVDGHSVNGTMAWSRSGTPATPAALPTKGSPPDPVDIQSGAYAADLLTGSDLTAIFGSPFPAPAPNGGHLNYADGIDTSNASAAADHYRVAYTVYLGATAAATSAFWTQQGLGQPDLAGTWKAAFWLSETTTLYVYATDTRVLSVQVFATDTTTAPSATALGTWQQLAEAIATRIVAALGPA